MKESYIEDLVNHDDPEIMRLLLRGNKGSVDKGTYRQNIEPRKQVNQDADAVVLSGKQNAVSNELERIRSAAKQNKEIKFTALMHHIMLKRYDIHCAKIWHKVINERDYIFVYHVVGQDVEEKMKGWATSAHPFDTWFRESIMAVYDIENVDGMEKPREIISFIA